MHPLHSRLWEVKLLAQRWGLAGTAGAGCLLLYLAAVPAITGWPLSVTCTVGEQDQGPEPPGRTGAFTNKWVSTNKEKPIDLFYLLLWILQLNTRETPAIWDWRGPPDSAWPPTACGTLQPLGLEAIPCRQAALSQGFPWSLNTRKNGDSKQPCFGHYPLQSV